MESQLGGYVKWDPLANAHVVAFVELATFLSEWLRCTANIASISHS